MMKRVLYTCLMFLAVLDSRAQFNLSPSTWPTPQGGEAIGSNQLGFNTISGAAVSGQALNSQSWALVDINGDKKPDLVVTAALAAGGATQFNATTSPGWKVYLNNGAGFNTGASTWSTPQVGIPLLGLNATSSAATVSQASGTASWDLVDMDGDGKPDLVVTSTVGPNGPAQFGAGTANQSWQVYLNTGSGFSNTANTWLTPTGGNFTGGNTLGFIFTSGAGAAGQDVGSQSWTLKDMDGDGKPDLVVTGGYQANGNTEVVNGGQAEWQVYLNTGTRFSANPTTWNTPTGGSKVAGNALGFNAANGNSSGQSTGSQSWSLLDINGDKKPDLVVTGAMGASSVAEIGSNTWNVYLNTGSGFAATATSWSTPAGGYVPFGSTTGIGFNGIANTGNIATQGVNSQTWVVTDLDGDGKPDLVVPASLGNQGPTEWSPGAGSYWEFYKNSGTGFSGSATYWLIPNGGQTNGGHYLGFNSTYEVASSGAGDALNSASWVLTDLDGTGFPDLVVTGTLTSNGNSEASPTSSPYWQVYRNKKAPLGTDVMNTSAATFDCKLYPNPNNGNFRLVFADDVVREVEVTDIAGQKLISNMHVSQEAEVALPSFAQGIYLVTIRENGLSKVMMVSVVK